MKNEKSGGSAVVSQTLVVAAVGLVLCAGAQFLYPLLGNAGIFRYSLTRCIFGGLYGWALGVGNFLAMGLTLLMLTSSTDDRKEGQKKGQALYMSRLVAVLLLAVGGCFIPVFHPLPLLVSLALTQLGIFLYALIFKTVERKKALPSAQRTDPGQEENAGDGVQAQDDVDGAQAQDGESV